MSADGATRSAGRERLGDASPAPSRREVLALAGVLTATLLTMAAAVAGLTRKPPQTPATPPTVSQIIGGQPTGTPRVEPGD